MPGGPKPGGGPGLSTPGGHPKPPHRGGVEPRGGRQHHPPYHQQHHQGPPPGGPGGPGGRTEEKISDSEVSVSGVTRPFPKMAAAPFRPPSSPPPPAGLHFVGGRKGACALPAGAGLSGDRGVGRVVLPPVGQSSREGAGEARSRRDGMGGPGYSQEVLGAGVERTVGCRRAEVVSLLTGFCSFSFLIYYLTILMYVRDSFSQGRSAYRKDEVVDVDVGR